MLTISLHRVFIVFAALSGLMAVAGGAYASHGLTDPMAIGWMRTASQYQMWHALALTAVVVMGALHQGGQAVRWFLTAAGLAFAFGIVLFCGSLYALALTGDHGLSRAAPAGGMAFMVGWIALALAGLGWRAGDPR